MSNNDELKRSLGAMLASHLKTFECQQRIPSVHVFGIEHGRSLSDLTVEDCKDVAELAGIKRSLGTELHKGVKLEPYEQRKTS